MVGVKEIKKTQPKFWKKLREFRNVKQFQQPSKVNSITKLTEYAREPPLALVGLASLCFVYFMVQNFFLFLPVHTLEIPLPTHYFPASHRQSHPLYSQGPNPCLSPLKIHLADAKTTKKAIFVIFITFLIN